MAKTIMVVMTAVVALSIFGSKDVLSMDLRQFQWKNRLLFLFAPQSTDTFLSNLQSEITAQKGEASERNLIVFKILETGPSFMDTNHLDPRMAETIRNKFDAPLGRFTCILVGKDGGVKFRQNAQVKLQDIFTLIDAMPMRQEEMRQKSQ
jgi:hypothetical protein